MTHFFLILLTVFLPTAFAEEMVIGLYGVNPGDEKNLPKIQKAGFNTIHTYQSDADWAPFLDACAKQKIRAVIPPGSGPRDFISAVAKTGSHPSLLAWYLVDEPDYKNDPPERTASMASELRATGTRVPIALVLGDGRAAGGYARIPDILMVDWYPIPHLPLASFGLAVRQCRFAAGPEKPLWGVVQAFDWTDFPESFPRSAQLGIRGYPTEAELLAMSYLNFVEGGTGIFFFGYNYTNRAPERWTALCNVSRELRRQAKILSAPTVWSQLDLWIDRDRPRWRNELGDAALQACRKRVPQTSGSVPAGDYLLVVNTTREERESGLRVPNLPDQPISVVGSTRSVPVRKGWIRDTFEPLAVRIYGPLPLPSEKP